MKILYTTLCLEKAGSHVVALTLASGMAKRHQCFFFNQGEQLVDSGMVKSYLGPGVTMLDMKYFPVLNNVLWKINGFLVKVSGYAKFHEFCKAFIMMYCIIRYRIDLVHGHEALTRQSRLAKVLRFLSVPVVITDHGGYTMMLKVGDTSFIPYANKARAIVAVAEYSSKVLSDGSTNDNSELLRITGRRIISADYQAEFEAIKSGYSVVADTHKLTTPVVTIYNGVLRYAGILPAPAALRAELGIASDAFVFGMVARGTEQKGWQHALTAYQQLKGLYPKRRFVWLCMGEGPCISKIKEKIGANHPDIIFLGNVDNPHYYMSGCHVGLVPSSFSEGLPLSIVEFYEHKVPVIASDLCGIPEVIKPANSEPGGQLILMEEDGTPNVASLLANMERYANDPALLAKHGEAAFSIRRQFDTEKFVQAHETLYSQVLNS